MSEPHEPFPVEAAFLGPYGENDELFERVLLEFLRDHVYWRRNFHPEDPPPISTFAAQEPAYRTYVAEMKRELHKLSASLKRSVPFSSPRYIGHMASDPLLPGLLAQMITLPYNPNNVVSDAAPVTVDMELEAGLQLARMIGYPSDPEAPDCAFGHITSGGTLANYEALVMARAIRFYPVACAAALRAERVELPALDPGLPEAFTELGDWQLVNLPVDTILRLQRQLPAALSQAHGERRAREIMRRVEAARIERLGMLDFFSAHPELGPPRVLIPYTAHYSWEKAMKLLGLGSAQLVHVPEQGMRMDPDALERCLKDAERERAPVLAVVGVFGTTEFGTIDPLDRIVAARRRWEAKGVDGGLSFAIHVDAAWGGYLTSVFRAADGSLRPREELTREFRYFPSQEVYDAFAALAETDSVTVDPHKLGYFPFGAGAFVCRDQAMADFVCQSAPYVFDPELSGGEGRARFRNLGRYILEGSKSGAMAAAVCVTHRLMPLDADHFGRLPAMTIRYTEHFYDRIRAAAEQLVGEARLVVPFEPDTNLICLAVNPQGNDSLAVANRFMRRLFGHLKVDPGQPLQVKEFFGSYTSLHPAALGQAETLRIMQELGLDRASLDPDPEDPEREADSIFILRHTLMNPWLEDQVNVIDYIQRYCDYLVELVRKELRE